MTLCLFDEERDTNVNGRSTCMHCGMGYEWVPHSVAHTWSDQIWMLILRFN